jgi:hypothetical protein
VEILYFESELEEADHTCTTSPTAVLQQLLVPPLSARCCSGFRVALVQILKLSGTMYVRFLTMSLEIEGKREIN